MPAKKALLPSRKNKTVLSKLGRIFKIKSGKQKRFFRLTAILIIVALVLGAIITASFSNFFKVQSIHIQRGDMLIDRNKIEKSLSRFLQQNMLFISSEDIHDSIRNDFPDIAEVSVLRKWPNQLQISVKSFPPAANVKVLTVENNATNPESGANEQKSLINSQGYIIEIEKEDPQFPTIIMKERQKKAALHEQLIDPETLSVIMHSLKLLQEYFHETAKAIEYFQNGREYHLILQNDTSLWLDFSHSPEEQLLKIKKAIPELNILENPMEYVDLRIKDKLIYK